jgi:hypothetical protein
LEVQGEGHSEGREEEARKAVREEGGPQVGGLEVQEVIIPKEGLVVVDLPGVPQEGGLEDLEVVIQKEDREEEDSKEVREAVTQQEVLQEGQEEEDSSEATPQAEKGARGTQPKALGRQEGDGTGKDSFGAPTSS